MLKILMRNFLVSFLGFIPILLSAQTANQAVLTLVDENNFNEVEIDLNVSGIGSSSDTSELTGTIEVQLNISPSTNTTDELTIISANVNGSDVSLSAGNFLASYSFETDGLGFSAETPEPPGTVEPATGEFDAEQHTINVDRGTLGGEAKIIGSTQDISYDFSEEGFVGQGAGTGTVSITPGRIEGRKLFFNVVLEFPTLIDQPIEAEDLPVDATVKIEGTLKAVGETFIEFPDYSDWAAEVGVTAASQNNFDLSSENPNAILFALGFDDETLPKQLFEVTQTGITLQVGGDIALGQVELQWSNDLSNWVRIPQASMVTGTSLINFGDPLTEAPVVQIDEDWKYLRVIIP